jgi:hypothetical protein
VNEEALAQWGVFALKTKKERKKEKELALRQDNVGGGY